MSKPQEKDKDNRTRSGAFNAFRLLKEAKQGRRTGRDGRESRSSAPKKAEDIPESELEITYAGKPYTITREGTLADPEKLSFDKGMVLGFSGIGSDRFSHMEVKVSSSFAYRFRADVNTETSLRYPSTYLCSCRRWSKRRPRWFQRVCTGRQVQQDPRAQVESLRFGGTT